MERNTNTVSVKVPDIPETRNFLALSSMVVPNCTMEEVACYGPCLLHYLENTYEQFAHEVLMFHLEKMRESGVDKDVLEMRVIIGEVLGRIRLKAESDISFREGFWKAFLADCVVRCETIDALRSFLRDIIDAMENEEGLVKVLS